MEYQKIINLLGNNQINHPILEQKVVLKQMTQMELIAPIDKLSLRIQC